MAKKKRSKKKVYRLKRADAVKAMERSRAQIEDTARGTPAGYREPKFRSK